VREKSFTACVFDNPCGGKGFISHTVSCFL